MSEPIQTKKCPQCKQIKPFSEFYKSKKDGLTSYCKSCKKIYQQNYRKTEKGKLAQKRYQQTEKGKITYRKGVAKYLKTPKGKAIRESFNARNPNYRKAKNAINNAIRDGKLPRAKTLLCHYCPKPAQQYHHWHGYEPEHWLDVVPACRKCHTNEHLISSDIG